MSAVAPLPASPEGPGASDDDVVPIGAASPPVTDEDGWTVLDAMRRRIDDQGAVVRKTQTQVGELAHSIAALVEDQRRRTHRINLNSFVAYAIFTLLVCTGFYLLYRSRVGELGESRERAVTERAEAVKRADDATAKLAARDAASAAAWEAYQLIESGRRGEAKDKLAALHDLPLSKTERAMLAAAPPPATSGARELSPVDGALKAAVASFKAGRSTDVIVPLEAALVAEPTAKGIPLVHYYLGVAYAKANDLAKAASHLTTALAGDVDQEDARFQLASVLDRAGQYPVARSEYDKFATAHPQSPLAVYAMRRSATLAHLVAPPAPVPAPAPKPVAPAAPPADPTP